MGLRKGLIGMGAGAAFVGLGVWSFTAGTHEQNTISREQSCATDRYSGSVACRDILVPTSKGMNAQNSIMWAEFAGSAIFVIGGAFGVAESYGDIEDFVDRPKEHGVELALHASEETTT